jgi:hypothetical protein
MLAKTRIAVAAAMLLSSASMATAAQSAADGYRPGENSTFETPCTPSGGLGSLRAGSPEESRSTGHRKCSDPRDDVVLNK